MESLELKGTSRIVCSSSSLSKEKIGPWENEEVGKGGQEEKGREEERGDRKRGGGRRGSNDQWLLT